MLVLILHDEIQCPWQISYCVQAIKDVLSKHTFYISHAFREANFVVDGLASEAIDKQTSKVFLDMNEMPKHIQGAAFLEKTSLPAIRA